MILAWQRDSLLAIDLIVVVSVFMRLCFSGSTGLAEWVYHSNRIDSMEQAPQAMGTLWRFWLRCWRRQFVRWSLRVWINLLGERIEVS